MTPVQKSLGGGMAPTSLVVIGASTGGTRILPVIFKELVPLRACILVVQHMPLFINTTFVRTLNQSCCMPVSLAENNMDIKPGTVLVAPSEVHCTLYQNRRIRLWSGEKVNCVCPAVDVTMQSLEPPHPGTDVWGVVLTGMGRDGAAGVVHIKRIGGKTIAQDKASCAVYGMPAEAAKTECVDYVLNPAGISRALNMRLAENKLMI